MLTVRLEPTRSTCSACSACRTVVDLTDAELIALVAWDGDLLARPIVEWRDRALEAWPAERTAELVGLG